MSTSILTRTYNMLTIFSPCECATDGPQIGAHDQPQQDHKRVQGVHKPEAKVQRHEDVPIFLRTAQPLHEKGCQFAAPGAMWSGRENLEIRVWKTSTLSGCIIVLPK